MTIQYTLKEEDYLQFQLLMVSRSRQLTKRRAIGRLFLIIIYGILGIVIWEKRGVLAAAFYFIICLPLYFLYLYMERRQFLSHFRKYTKTQYSQYYGKTFTLDLNPDELVSSDGDQRARTPLSSVVSILETGTLFILMLKEHHPILISKSNPAKLGEVKSWLTSKAADLNIPYEEQLTWKWK